MSFSDTNRSLALDTVGSQLVMYGSINQTIGVQASGTFSGTVLTPQASMDGGQTWKTVTLSDAVTGAAVVAITAAGNWEFVLGGFNVFRVVNTTATASGSCVINLVATLSTRPLAGAGGGGGTASSVTVTSSALPTGASQDGSDATGITQLSGGTGIRGWLSGIFSKLSGVLSTSQSNLTATSSGLGTLNATLGLAVGPLATVGMKITQSSAGATFTLQPQASRDGGATWDNVSVLSDSPGSTSTPQTTITSVGRFKWNPAGYTNFQLLNTVVSSAGTVSASLAATNAVDLIRSSAIGDQADIAATTDTGTASQISLLKRLLVKTPALGIAAPSASVPVTESSITGVAPITVGTTTTAGRLILINCTAAGNVNLTFSDASTLIFPVSVGMTILPWQVTQVSATNTTATATYFNLK